MVLFIGSALNGQKSYKIYTESYKICAYALRHTFIGVAWRREINQKLNSKLIALRAEIIGARACGTLGFGVCYAQKFFKIYSKSNRILTYA